MWLRMWFHLNSTGVHENFHCRVDIGLSYDRFPSRLLEISYRWSRSYDWCRCSPRHNWADHYSQGIKYTIQNNCDKNCGDERKKSWIEVYVYVVSALSLQHTCTISTPDDDIMAYLTTFGFWKHYHGAITFILSYQLWYILGGKSKF